MAFEPWRSSQLLGRLPGPLVMGNRPQVAILIGGPDAQVRLCCCQRISTSGLPASLPIAAPPMYWISDGAHHAGNEEFFFLQPLISEPSSCEDYGPGAEAEVRRARTLSCSAAIPDPLTAIQVSPPTRATWYSKPKASGTLGIATMKNP